MRNVMSPNDRCCPNVAEGEPFTVAEVGFRGYTVFEEAELREGMKIKEGEIFQRAKIRDEITRLTDVYGSRGYAFAEVVPNVNPNNEERTASIILNIKEGEMMRIILRTSHIVKDQPVTIASRLPTVAVTVLVPGRSAVARPREVIATAAGLEL